VTSAFWGVVVVSVGIVFARAGLTLVQRSVPLRLRESHNTAMGTIYAALYVMYALALAFSLFIVWSEFREAQRTTESEANAVGDLFHLGGQFPEPEHHRIQELSRSYARVVAEEEWPLLGGAHEGRGSPRAQALADELVETVEHFEPTSKAQQTLYGEGITVVQDLEDNRQLRLLESHQGIPFILWVVLIVGGVLTISLGFLFGMKSRWLHQLSITALTILIVLILYTIHLIEYPFTSDVQVPPTAFESISHQMEGETNNE
jgi:hypothetical protein